MSSESALASFAHLAVQVFSQDRQYARYVGMSEVSRERLEKIGRAVVEGAIEVHRALGPGLLESAYQECLAYELAKRRLSVERETAVPVEYDGRQLATGFRIDLLVEGAITVENKTVERLLPIHEAQLLTYLRLKGCRLGFLLNWKVSRMKEGIRRMVLGF